MITDGVISDMVQTKEAVVNVSKQTHTRTYTHVLTHTNDGLMDGSAFPLSYSNLLTFVCVVGGVLRFFSRMIPSVMPGY